MRARVTLDTWENIHTIHYIEVFGFSHATGFAQHWPKKWIAADELPQTLTA